MIVGIIVGVVIVAIIIGIWVWQGLKAAKKKKLAQGGEQAAKALKAAKATSEVTAPSSAIDIL